MPDSLKASVGQNTRHHPRVTWSRLKLKWPVLIWLFSVLAAGLMFVDNTTFQHLTGMVQVNREEIASIEPARIRSIPVTVGQVVTQGQILVEMDTRLLDAEMDVEKIQIRRQFAQLIQDQEGSLRDMQIQLAQSEAELAVVAVEVARLEGLRDRRLVDARTVAGVKAREESLKTVVELFPKAIIDVETRLNETRKQQDKLLDSLTEDVSSVALASAAPADRERLSFLQLRRNNYLLRATREGNVSRIFKEEGEVVAAGELILTVVTPKPAQVLGFLPEANVQDVWVGMDAEVKHIPGGVFFPAKVSAMSPEVQALPGRVSSVPGQTTRGIRVVFEPSEDFSVTPGSAVTIRIPEGQQRQP